jgi:hypothetical protein
MALVLDETFTTAPAGGFATTRAQIGALTATHNAAEAAVDLAKTGDDYGLYEITSQPLRTKGEVEIDIQVTAMHSVNVISGFLLSAGQASVSNGLMLRVANGAISSHYWTGTPAWTNAVGDRATLRIVWDYTSSGGQRGIEFYINGVLTWALCANSLAANFASGIRPGVVLYGTSVRLHSIKVWDAPQNGMTRQDCVSTAALRQSVTPDLPANFTSQPAHSALGVLLQTNNTAPAAGRGSIVGTVKEKGAPNMPVKRRVILVDERSMSAFAETWSDTVTGAYRFDNLDTALKFTVLSYDHTGNYRAVIADGQVPVWSPT